jgi:hypothetical protein
MDAEHAAPVSFCNHELRVTVAFSSEVDTGSREENASK